MQGVKIMEAALNKKPADTKHEEETILRMLDRGIDDMESGRELPLAEAFDKITELRNVRRNAKL